MGDNSERQALLMQDRGSQSENYRGDGSSSEVSGSPPSHSGEWWDGSGSETGSSGSSSYSSSGSDSELEWESEVNQRGDLFFIESNPQLEVEPVFEVPLDRPDEAETSTPLGRNGEGFGLQQRKQHTAKSKLLRLIRRRNSKRQRGKVVTSGLQAPAQIAESANLRANKVRFHDWQDGETRTVELTVDPSAAHNLGRRATLTETLLGLTTATFADATRIMVAGTTPGSHAARPRGIKVGDWLRSVDGQEVTVHNIDQVLASITAPCKVKLQLQRVAGCEVGSTPPSTDNTQNKATLQSHLVQQLVGSYQHELATLLATLPVGLLYLTQEGLSETGPEDQGVLYCYPPPAATNALSVARGSFITLHHLLPQLANSKPVSSTVLLRGELVHVMYVTQPAGQLMLLALPDTRCSLQEAQHLVADLVRNLQFSHQTLERCFSDKDNHGSLDHFLSLFFARLLSSGLWPSARQSVQLEDITSKSRVPPPPQFEDVLLAAKWLPLPRDTQLQVDEALSELEANDFGEMSDDLSGYQRLYTIIGSCLYHKGWLLASHLQHADLVDVNSFCRQQGLLHLGRAEPVRSLVVWREVYPSSCDRGLERETISPYKLPQGRWFLLIVGKGHEMLVVLLESGGCTIRATDSCGPDVVYVEQAQDTLAHVQKLGVAAVVDLWLGKAARPQVNDPDNVLLARTTTAASFLQGITPTKLVATATGLGSSVSSSPSGKKQAEVASILKRRSPDRSGNPGSVQGYHGDRPGSASEDSHSRAASLASELSDDLPVLGRRAERERGASKLSDSESDSDCYRSDSRSYELPDKTSFLDNLQRVLPTQLTAGEDNVLFHYVRLDLAEGVLICSPDAPNGSAQLSGVLAHFRRSAHTIHNLLQNTVHFKKLAGDEISKSPVNKSLIAIKEHGVLFECSASEADAGGGRRTTQPLTYWVVGRLFFTPLPREVFVCYHDSAPQNMVEIAFRLALSAAG